MILKVLDKQGEGAHGFLSLDEYIRDLKLKGYKVAWLKTLNLGQTPPEQVHNVMAATAAQNRKVKRPAVHFVFAFPPDERPDQKTCIAIVEQSLEWLGLGDHQAMVIADDEKQHFHLHVMANIVHPHTGRASKFRERHKLYLAVVVAAQIEKQFGLIQVPRPTLTEEDIIAELTGNVPPTKIKAKEEREKKAREQRDLSGNGPSERVKNAQLIGDGTDVTDVADTLRELLDRTPSSFKTWDELHQYFVKHEIHYRAAGAGATMGIAGHETRASRVERGWSLPNLQKQLSGEPPAPMRLGVPPPPKTKRSPVADKNPITGAPLVELAAKLEATSLVFRRVEDDGSTRRLTIAADQLPANVPSLIRASQYGANILVAPVASDRHFLPVQEMSPGELATLESDHTPAAVIARGDVFDAFIAIEKMDAHPDAESAAARQLTADLQQQYAPRSRAMSAIGVLPAPGFPLRERPRDSKTSTSTVVSLIRPIARFCGKATAKFKKLVKKWEAKLATAFRGRGSNSAMIGLQRFDLCGPPQTTEAAIYHAHMADLAEHTSVKGFTPESLDRLLAQRLRDGGSPKTHIAGILEAGMVHIGSEKEDAHAKASELATWITNPATMETHPSIAAMAPVWGELTKSAKDRFSEIAKSAEQDRSI